MRAVFDPRWLAYARDGSYTFHVFLLVVETMLIRVALNVVWSGARFPQAHRLIELTVLTSPSQQGAACCGDCGPQLQAW